MIPNLQKQLLRTFDTPDNNRNLIGLALITGVAGIFLRFWGLSEAPLAVDEYYLGTSMLNLAEYGLPQFPCGGYYTRGLVIQYLSWPLVEAGVGLELTTRIWPAIASVFAMIAVWRIGLLAGGHTTATIATILVSLSLWEIEFARFGRMYSPFQAIFLWYIYFQIRDLVHFDERARWWCLGLSTLALAVYEGAALLLALNFLPLVWAGRRWTTPHLLLSFVLLIGAIEYIGQDFRHLGLADGQLLSPPDDGTSTAIHLPIDLPSFPGPIFAIVLVAFIVLGILFWRFRRKLELAHPSILLWLLALLMFVTGFVLFSLALGLAAVLMRLPSPLRDMNWRAKHLVGLAGAASVVWVAVLLAFLSAGDIGTDSALKDALKYSLNFPDVYYKVVRPWLRAIPLTSVLLAALVIVSLIVLVRLRRDDRPELRVTGYLFGTLILLVLAVGLLQQPYSITRYTYFVYPLVIVLAAFGIHRIGGSLQKEPPRAFALCLILLAPLFVLAEDYRLAHMGQINEPEYRYRTAYDEELTNHYYTRWDFRAAAEYVNAHLSPGDSVIAFDQPFAHYLSKTSGHFVRKGTKIHKLVWACGGNRHLWSNAPLFDDDLDVGQTIESTNGYIWILMHTAKYAYRDPLEIELPVRYAVDPEFVSKDGHLAVYKIPGRSQVRDTTGDAQI